MKCNREQHLFSPCFYGGGDGVRLRFLLQILFISLIDQHVESLVSYLLLYEVDYTTFAIFYIYS